MQVSSLLRNAGIKTDDIPGLDELQFQPGSSYCKPFYKLETQHPGSSLFTLLTSTMW